MRIGVYFLLNHFCQFVNISPNTKDIVNLVLLPPPRVLIFQETPKKQFDLPNLNMDSMLIGLMAYGVD